MRAEFLLDHLPPLAAWAEGNGDEPTRAVLHWFLELSEVEVAPIMAPAALCPNCGIRPGAARSGDACREESALVRQFRGALEGGAIESVERQVALGEKLWRVLGGGYPRRAERVPPRVLRQVIERQGGLCACGAPADRVDHCGSG